MSPSLYIGTAGWAYPHWSGVVFPKSHTPGHHALEVVSSHLDMVEVNSSFYQFLKPEIVKLWMRKVEANPRFLFTAKLHQRFTHARILDPKEIAAFKEGLLPLMRGKKLGSVLMQFPWSYRFTAENRDFFIRLSREFREFPLAAEMRHSSWMAEEAVGTFLDYRVGFCNIDQPEYTRAMPPTAFLTSGTGYVRLHGRNPDNALGGYDGHATRMRQHDYLYSQAELTEWAQRIEHVQRYAEHTFVVFNNDAGGKSFVNALQLRAAMTGSHVNAPKELRRRFPVQLSGFGPGQEQQQCLFSAA